MLGSAKKDPDKISLAFKHQGDHVVVPTVMKYMSTGLI
jgi:hypothetical protein